MKKRLFFSLEFLGRVALATVLPLVVFGVIGRMIDKNLNLGYTFFATGVLFAIFTTIFIIRKLRNQITKKFEELD